MSLRVCVCEVCEECIHTWLKLGYCCFLRSDEVHLLVLTVAEGVHFPLPCQVAVRELAIAEWKYDGMHRIDLLTRCR